MANEEHFIILTKGVSAWNEWRRKNPRIIPDLSNANLQSMYLECINFEDANLTGANLSQCKLRWARFAGAILDSVNVDEADIVNTILPSILKEQSNKKKQYMNLKNQSQKTREKYIQDFDSQDIEDQDVGIYKFGFSDDYRKAIEESLKAFIRDGDDVVCIGYYVYQYGSCEMCSHTPIKWHYVLENLQSHSQMHVGSECIQNFQVILSEWGYRPEYIVFPDCLRPYTRWILDKNPRSIVFDDDLVVYLNQDCEKIIKGIKENSQLKHYRYVKRTIHEGVEKLIAISNPFRQLNDSKPILETQILNSILEGDDYPPF